LFQVPEQKDDQVCFYMALDEIPDEFVSDCTVYFLRETKERVTEPKDLAEANEVLPEVIKSGVLTDDTLLMLKNVISQVKAISGVWSVSVSDLPVWNETQMNRQKFLSVTQQTKQQTEGKMFCPCQHYTRLEMPIINLDGDVTDLATVPEVVEALEGCAVTWQELIATVLEEQLKKVPQGNGPLAEVNFWREKYNILHALNEQTKLPKVQKVLEILQEAESENIGDLQVVISDLR
ncbi:DYH10 protein, partial [Alcedo cyanopectus]|nr:DYH10 protein [Ceyx cyanopectus]